MSAVVDIQNLETEPEIEEDEANVVYDIATYPSDFTLSGIFQMWKDGDIIIPEFQREFVWSIRQASLLVDSFLLGLPVPSVFFYIGDDMKNLVIDGQQRILSVVFFMEGFFGHESTHGKRQVFRLTGLSPKSPYYNKQFKELSDSDQRKFKQAVLRAINIRQLSPDPEGEVTSAYHIFERLNTGGTRLKPQEIRNCVFLGEFNQTLKEANKDKHWRMILGKKTLDRNQTDVELILRIFSLVESAKTYKNPMKEFLNKAMKRHRRGNSPAVERFAALFPLITELVVKALGNKPFHLRGPLNISALDSVMWVLFENHGSISETRLRERYSALKQEPEFLRLTQLGTSDTKTVQDRLEFVRKFLIGA